MAANKNSLCFANTGNTIRYSLHRGINTSQTGRHLAQSGDVCGAKRSLEADGKTCCRTSRVCAVNRNRDVAVAPHIAHCCKCALDAACHRCGIAAVADIAGGNAAKSKREIPARGCRCRVHGSRQLIQILALQVATKRYQIIAGCRINCHLRGAADRHQRKIQRNLHLVGCCAKGDTARLISFPAV